MAESHFHTLLTPHAWEALLSRVTSLTLWVDCVLPDIYAGGANAVLHCSVLATPSDFCSVPLLSRQRGALESDSSAPSDNSLGRRQWEPGSRCSRQTGVNSREPHCQSSDTNVSIPAWCRESIPARLRFGLSIIRFTLE